ncbi:hypothetical protein HDE_04452 [Halotydeus destructor]|nr:hypothetical protein HDE_04452 [Halotydeus destructor]
MNSFDDNGFFSTARNNEYYVHGSYIYGQKLKRDDDKRYFSCIKNCGVNIVLKKIEEKWVVTKETGVHNHTPDRKHHMNQLFKNDVKKEIANSPDSSARDAYKVVHSRWSPRMTNEMHHILKPFESIRSGLQKYKKKLEKSHHGDATEFKLTGLYVLTVAGEKFLIFDEVVSDIGRIVIFGSPRMFEKMVRSELLLMDGTFQTAPAKSYQLYSMHFVAMDHVFPAIYALLPNQTTRTYRFLLRTVKRYIQGVTGAHDAWPSTVQIDFEQAMVQALKTEWAVIQTRGCYFHYTQAIWRKTQKVGLATAYIKGFQTEGPIRKYVQRISALPMVPETDLDEAWVAVNADLEVALNITEQERAACLDIRSYVERTWLGYAALFKRDMWNHHDNEGRRTNNDVEGWHNALRRTMAGAHPDIFRFINKLKMMNDDAEGKLYAVTSGQKVKRRGSKYAEISEEIEIVKDNYNKNNIYVLEYLDVIGQKIKHV